MNATIEIIHEVISGESGEWSLCFQWAQYNYNDGSSEKGYRFMWRAPDGSLQPSRGQARIPSAKDIFYLFQKATEDGWFITCETEKEEV